MQEYPDEVLQAHLERLSDFLACGEGAWWHYEGDFIVFHDGDDEEESRTVGPKLMKFDSTSMQEVYVHLKTKWMECVHNTNIDIPLKTLKIYNELGDYQKSVVMEEDSVQGQQTIFVKLNDVGY